MTEPLKPYPFCGDPAVLDTCYDFYRVRCDYPECPGNVKNGEGIWYGTIEHAMQRWNTRAERTCKVRGSIFDDIEGLWQFDLSCGDCISYDDKEPPAYCPECGAKVVE